MVSGEPANSVRAGQATLDRDEVERFGRLAGEWWDPKGKFRPLHKLGPARLSFIRSVAERQIATAGGPGDRMRPLAGLDVLDVGCGGGLVSEPLARLGGRVVGIDPAEENVAAARAHAGAQALAIDYRAARLEDVVAAGSEFDLVVCLEVLEHVPEPAEFVALLKRAVRPGGALVLSTINRTLRAYALAIVGAEYVLGWLPVGTHRWDRFITPEELERMVVTAGLAPKERSGLVLDPLTGEWVLAEDSSVNYLAAAVRPVA